MQIDSALFRKAAARPEVECCYRDLIYSLMQAFSLTIWAKSEGTKIQWTNVIHDALLETSLLNLRSLDEFLVGKKSRKGREADITIDDVRDLGFSKSVGRILTPDEAKTISQLFAHITANRNPARARKQPFPLGRYLSNAVKSLDPVLEFFEQRIAPADGWTPQNIRNYRAQFSELLEAQRNLDKKVTFEGVHFYVSGSYLRIA